MAVVSTNSAVSLAGASNRAQTMCVLHLRVCPCANSPAPKVKSRTFAPLWSRRCSVISGSEQAALEPFTIVPLTSADPLVQVGSTVTVKPAPQFEAMAKTMKTRRMIVITAHPVPRDPSVFVGASGIGIQEVPFQ
jgi:hypothetical protein